MNNSDHLLYTAAQSRAIDAHAIAQMPILGLKLMQRAADAAFDVLLQSFSGAKSVSVICGKGNNAGDAYLVAMLAQRQGFAVQVLALVAPAQLAGDAAAAYNLAIEAGVVVQAPAGGINGRIVGDVVIDGLLGTGIAGAPRHEFAQAIDAINASGKPVLAIDIPSGVNADTGAVVGSAVHASCTVSFITRKLGLYTGAGVSFAGVRHFHALGVSEHIYSLDDATSPAGVPYINWQAEQLPRLDANTYKHRQGHVVIAGGDVNMPGAVSMAAHAALRAGAGMVTIVSHASHTAAYVARTPEVMVVDAQSELVDDILGRADLVVLGPGLGRTEWSEHLYRIVEQSSRPTLLDADGLWWLAQRGSWAGGSLVMTPHIAEAGRLLDRSAQSVQDDRLGACRQLATRFDCGGVLKGAGSVLFDGGRVAICAHGNAGMAAAGMGDVLSGIAAGLLVQLAPQDDDKVRWNGLCSAVTLHSAAADQAASVHGERSLMATDVIDVLPMMMQSTVTL